MNESNKSGDSSLHDWFTKSRASDGTPGWVQLGGKYAGKPCAKQPGQTTKPKCGSSKMKRNLDKGEEERAFRRKNRQDPNPNRKGKAKNVATEETINERGDFWHPDPEKDRKLGGPGANQRAREDRGQSTSAQTKPDYSKRLKPGESYMDFAKRKQAERTRKEEMELDEKCWKGYTQKGMKKKGNRVVPNCVPVGEEKEGDHEYEMARRQLATMKNAAKRLEKKMGKKGEGDLKAWVQAKLTKAAYHVGTAADYVTNEAKNIHGDIEVPSGNGGKLKKLASRAAKRIDTDVDGDVEHNDKHKGEYGEFVPTGGDPRKAQGRQFTSMKVKSVKEALGEVDEIDEGIKMTLVKAIDKTKPGPLTRRGRIRDKLVRSEIKSAAEKSKKRRFSGLAASEKASKADKYMSAASKTTASESFTIDPKEHRKQQRAAKIRNLAQKGATEGEKAAAEKKTKGPKMFGESAAWTRKAGKNKEGGLNEKGRKSYERENPGSDLKAPSKKVGNPRRKSFCARMSGMKKKLTSSKTANDPNSRINKSLRAWNC